MKELQPDLREKLQVMSFEDLLEQVLELSERNDQLEDLRTKSVSAAAQSQRNLDAAIAMRNEVAAENAGLRDELHRLTVENARLEGYRDRVHEFDPIPDQQQYEDNRLERGFAPRRDLYRVEMADTFGAPRPSPWYRRG